MANKVITLLDKRFPGLATKVEVCDMVTPITWERYTANRRGSYEDGLIAIKPLAILMSKTLPVPKNFYMAGQ